MTGTLAPASSPRVPPPHRTLRPVPEPRAASETNALCSRFSSNPRSRPPGSTRWETCHLPQRAVRGFSSNFTIEPKANGKWSLETPFCFPLGF